MNPPRWYTLDENRRVILAPDIDSYMQWLMDDRYSQMPTEYFRVGEDVIGPSRVSTVFLGLDHGYMGGPPILWETMVFGGPMNNHQRRCSGTFEQAEAMHQTMMADVRASLEQTNYKT